MSEILARAVALIDARMTHKEWVQRCKDENIDAGKAYGNILKLRLAQTLLEPDDSGKIVLYLAPLEGGSK